MPKFTVATAAVASALLFVNGKPLLRRKLQSSEPDSPLSGGAAASVTVIPFSYPYPANSNVMGLQCNTEVSEATTGLHLDTHDNSLKSCVYDAFMKSENVAEAVADCIAASASAPLCPTVQGWMSGFLCDQEEPFCERNKASVGSEPDEIPFDVDEGALELPFETPELPLPEKIESFLSDRETTTASLLWMANVRNYQLAENFKCAEGREKSYTEREVLPGWKAERLFTPEYVEETEESNHPWVSVSSRGQSLLVVVRGTQAFGEWVSDLDLEQVPAPLGMPGKLTRGYSTPAGKVVEELRKMITEKTDRVIVTGHSLGGYAGQIVAAGLQSHIEASGLSTKLFGVLFASGRVGDADYQEAMNAKVNLRHVLFGADPGPMAVSKKTPNCGLPGSFDFGVSHIESSSSSGVDDEKKTKEGGEGNVEIMSFTDRTGVLTFSDSWLNFFKLAFGMITSKDVKAWGNAAHHCSYQCHAVASQPGADEEASLCSKKTCFDYTHNREGKEPEEEKQKKLPATFADFVMADLLRSQGN